MQLQQEKQTLSSHIGCLNLVYGCGLTVLAAVQYLYSQGVPDVCLQSGTPYTKLFSI